MAPDGRTIVYGAAWDGSQASFLRPDGQRRGRAARHTNADILAISSKGELAILLKKSYLASTVGAGTLARVPFGGGAPREVAENIMFADWSPDGSELAVIRVRSGETSRLEYPSERRFTRRRTALASSACLTGATSSRSSKPPRKGSFVAVADLSGKVRTLSGPWFGVESPDWRPDDRSLVFTSDGRIREVSLGGKERMLYWEGLIHDLLPTGGC